MRTAVISDIHGNLEALEAVLRHVEGQRIDSIWCLGDVVGYGCDPVRCLELVKANCGITLRGNHEAVVLGLLPSEVLNEFAREAMAWTIDQLGEAELELMRGYRVDAVVDDAYLVHASPHEPEWWHYVFTPDAASAAFRDLHHNLCFFGHTHVPMIFSMPAEGQIRQRTGHDFLPDKDVKYLVNVGAVGQPRDSDPRACYAIFDADEYEITYHRLEYDIQQTQRKMADANAPAMLIERLAAGR